MNVQADRLPEGHGRVGGRTARPWRRVLILLIVLALVVAGAQYVAHEAKKYFTILPGNAPEITTSASCRDQGEFLSFPDNRPCVLIEAPKSKIHPIDGKLLMVDVGLSQTTSREYILHKLGLLDRVEQGAELVPSTEILGTSTESQYDQENVGFMIDAQQAALVVALRRLGYKVPEIEGAGVVLVQAHQPASGRLSVGDVIIEVDGRRVDGASQLVAQTSPHRPGDKLRLVVADTSGRRRNVTITLGRRPPGTPGRGGYMGVEIENGATFAYPFGIKLVVGDIDGPSAGLSFTLAVMDWLGGGDLTGGKTVAATGTMSFNGAVGEVGGVAQKAIAVRRAGAAMFIVPRAEYAQARANAGSTMKVVGVDNVSQALSALATIGGRVGKPSGNP